MATPQPVPASSNPLYDLVPASQRRRVYAIFALVGLIATAVQLAFLAIDPNLPMWLNISIVVYNFLAVPFGALAASNTPSPENPVVVVNGPADVVADDQMVDDTEIDEGLDD